MVTETMVILLTLKIFLAFSIMLGNGLIIMAFVVDKNLRLRNNYFFLNLAIADFFVGAICIPLYIPYEWENKWSFGSELCIFWLVIDYLLCTTSVYNIVLISYDRYQSICHAISYRTKQTSISRTVTYMVAAWVLAFLVHGPAILNGSNKNSENTECRNQLLLTTPYIIITSILEFLIPTILVTYFNCCIYWSLHSRGTVRGRPVPTPNILSPVQGNSMTCTFFSKMCFPKLDEEVPSSSVKKMRRKNLSVFLKTQGEGETASVELSSLSHSNTMSVDLVAQRWKLLRDRKVAKSLAIILGAFIFCWAPYILFTIIRSFHKNDAYDFWYDFTFWLQWFNSFLNPFLYSLCHKKFRNAFVKIFCKKKVIASSQISLST
ncbi:histamine H4 receptor-like [Vombatus ursinus]|uniref:G-protein coupled receptors family 1 profile domain-containing protein n=1 Tax=Vombatus ursinus TaxID=29139 RepID=A0A4X2KK69_VOMUR|nr:histamine H4 receptor-like [Vombatus ursinus]XP_027733245.1 histamine H4 receptor-like [Vombatus ursinus]